MESMLQVKSNFPSRSRRAPKYPTLLCGLIAGKKDEDGGDLGAPEDSLCAELFHLLLWHNGGDKRSPARIWGYCVNSNALFDGKAGKGPGEADDSCFGRGVG